MREPFPERSPECFTVSDFCAAHRVSRRKFYDLLNRGELAARKLGRRTVILAEDARKWRESLEEWRPA